MDRSTEEALRQSFRSGEARGLDGSPISFCIGGVPLNDAQRIARLRQYGRESEYESQEDLYIEESKRHMVKARSRRLR